jgi:type II secretory pathway pseudopilin PulG
MGMLLTTTMVLVGLVGAVLGGRYCARRVPELSADSRDTVKLALGLVATMSALVLSLLVSSSKANFDLQRDRVLQMDARVAILDRVLALYGAESAAARAQVVLAVEDARERMWPTDESRESDLAPNPRAGDAVYEAIQALSPNNETQADLKVEAARLMVDLWARREQLEAEASISVSIPLFVVVVCWLFVILFGFSVIAPKNAITTTALLASAAAVTSAVFLILELNQPFDGAIRISEESLSAVLPETTPDRVR